MNAMRHLFVAEAAPAVAVLLVFVVVAVAVVVVLVVVVVMKEVVMMDAFDRLRRLPQDAATPVSVRQRIAAASVLAAIDAVDGRHVGHLHRLAPAYRFRRPREQSQPIASLTLCTHTHTHT